MNLSDFSLDLFSLKGKTAIVTGGNGGLGQAFSMAMAKAGANVFIASYEEDNDETIQMLEKEGIKAHFMQCDLTQEGVSAQVIQSCLDKFDHLDILINCAGLCINEPDVTKYGRKQWDPMIALNLTAVFDLSHEAAEVMIPQKSGKIINIGSLFSFLGGQWSPAYTATKHGVAGFTKAYCDELAQFNIQVNCIAPGYYATKLTEKTRENKETNDRVLSHIPANRWGDPMDLMGATVFLASSASNYVNGHVLTVDGGYLMR